MTTDELRAKFEEWYSQDFYDGTVPGPTWIEERNCYQLFADHLSWKAYQAAHASRDSEVEALKKHVGNVVRQMKNCASDVSQTRALTGQWVADTINWFADEIGIDAAMQVPRP